MRHRTVFRSQPWLYATWDTSRGIAAISGIEAEEMVFRVAPVSTSVEPQWSRRVRGWVVPECVLHDLCAYAKSIHEWIYIRQIVGPLPGELDEPPAQEGESNE